MPAAPSTELSVDYGADFGAQPPRGADQVRHRGRHRGHQDGHAVRAGRAGGGDQAGRPAPWRHVQLGHGVPGPLQPLAHGLRGPVRRVRRPRPRAHRDGAERARRRAAARDRRGDEPGGPGEPHRPDEASGAAATITGASVPEPAGIVPEEERSRRPTVFSAIREVIALFAGPDEHLGLYGAFGYDLAFQFEPIRLRPGRESAARASSATWCCTCPTRST